MNSQGWYAATVVPAYAILAVSACVAFHLAGGSPRKLRACIPFGKNSGTESSGTLAVNAEM